MYIFIYIYIVYFIAYHHPGILRTWAWTIPNRKMCSLVFWEIGRNLLFRMSKCYDNPCINNEQYTNSLNIELFWLWRLPLKPVARGFASATLHPAESNLGNVLEFPSGNDSSSAVGPGCPSPVERRCLTSGLFAPKENQRKNAKQTYNAGELPSQCSNAPGI